MAIVHNNPVFPKGARVKLTDRYATTLNNRRGGGTATGCDWLGRRGIVHYCNEHEVVIIWDGRKTKDRVPHKAVELVNE